MKLNEIFKDIKYTCIKGDMDTSIDDIICDSREVKKDTLFIAIVGAESDGHKYIHNAIENGAKAVLVSKNVEISEDIVVIKVADTRKILSKFIFLIAQR